MRPASISPPGLEVPNFNGNPVATFFAEKPL
jgi:hypothetical protein